MVGERRRGKDKKQMRSGGEKMDREERHTRAKRQRGREKETRARCEERQRGLTDTAM